MGRRVHGLLAALAILLVAAYQVLGPADGGPFSDAGGAIAASTAASHRGIGALGVVDSAAPAATAVLLLSVLVAGAIGSALLAGPARPEEARDEEAGLRIPGAALLGHGGGILVAALGGGGPAAYGTACLVASAALLLPGPVRARRTAAAARPGAARAAGLLLLGAVLFLAAGGADGVVQALSRARPVPEAWFVAAAEAGAGWLRVPVIGVLAGAAAAAAGMEVCADRRGAEAWWDLPAAAAAWALLLGPSNPCRALAIAWSLRCLARAGAGPALRAGFVAAVVAGMAGVVHL